MFGQSNTPFGSSGGGGGGFGQQQQQQQSNTAPAFGSPAPAAGGLFGSPAPAQQGFGAPAPAQQQGFGGGFGAPAPAQGGGGGGLFGAPAPAPQGFGGGGGFGGASSGGYGAPAPAPSGGMFGAPAPAQQGGFGTPAPAQGGGLFGAPAAGQSPFGGGAPAPQSGFGGATGGFGAPAPQANTGFGGGGGGGAFGQPQQQQQQQQSSAFGAPAPAQGGGLFGAPAPAAGGGFGGGFGAAPAPAQGGMFGAPAPAQGGFGAPAASPAGGGLFGGAAASPSQQQQGQGGGTRVAPYQVTQKQDGSSTIQLQAITAMPQYEHKSFEELRFEDYSQGNRGSSTPQAATQQGGFGGGFGSPAPAQQGGFGAPAPAAGGGLFGAPAPAAGGGGGLFGAPAPAAGGGFGGGFGGATPAPAGGGGLFGAPAPAAGGGFGGGFGGAAPAPAGGGGLFGAPAPAAGGGFGAPAPAGGGLFGAPAPAAAGAFGAPPPAGGGLFGAPAPAPGGFGAPAGGGFGAPAPAAGGLFGSPSPAPAFGGYGAPAAGGLFGSSPAPAPYGAPATGGFGAPAAAPFGAPQQPGGYGGFGSPPPAPAYGGYGAPPPQQQYQQQGPPQQYGAPAVPVNVNIIPQAANEVLEQQLRAMDNKKKELEKFEAWGGTPNGSQSTPTGLPERESYVLPSRTYSPSLASSPRSGVKIKPRGFPKSEPAQSSVAAASPYASVGRDNSGLMSPESHLRSNVMHLRIQPNSLKKPNLRLRGFDSPAAMKPSGPRAPVENIDSPPPNDSFARARSPANNASATPSVDPTPSPRTMATPSPSATHMHPATTPEYDYYQKVIGSTNESSSVQQQTSSSGRPSATRMPVPTLTKSGYDISPSLEELSNMSEADLAAVPGFAVKRPGVGKVEWEGAVDVRRADLDRIVEIEFQDVAVYTLDEEEGKKPPVGSKLNRPAILTFYNVFPKKGGASATQEDRDKFARKVEKTTSKIGADLISYDRNIGEWKIRVQHFSRYAIDDDDDSDVEEDVLLANQPPIGSPEAIPEKSRSIVDRKATPFKASRINFQAMDESENESVDMEEDYAVVSDGGDVEMDETNPANFARFEADKASAQMLALIDDSAAAEKVQSPPEKAEKFVFEEEGDNDDSDDESYIPANAPTEKDYRRAASASSISAKIAGKSKIQRSNIDYGLRMGRSFRVGWNRDGSFFKLSSKKAGSSPALVKCRPKFVGEMAARDSTALLESQLVKSQRVQGADNECPLFALPQGFGNSGTVSSHSDLYDTLLLFASTCPDKEAKAGFMLLSLLLATNEEGVEYSSLVLAEYGADSGVSSLNARRLAAVSVWLKDLCSASVEADIQEAKLRNDTPSAVFAALSGGAVDRACELAAEGGLMNLAVALSSDLGGRKDILEQIFRLSESGDISKTFSETVRCLKNSAGDLHSEDVLSRNGANSLDWRRRLALRLLQEPESDLLGLVRHYDSDVQSGSVPFPSPRYLTASKSIESLHFRLLRLCADSQSMSLSETVDPVGFTSSIHDFSLSFHLASAVSAVGPSNNTSDSAVEHILDGYEAQLASQGRWEWAVFVSLCSIGDMSDETKRSKVQRAKNLVLQNFCVSDHTANRRRAFLEKKIGIPSEWFEEALAYQAANRGELLEYIVHLLAYDTKTALDVLEERYLPNVFFMSKHEIDHLMHVIETVAVAQEDSLAKAVYRFFILDKRVKELVDADQDEITDALPELFDNYESVEETLLSFRSRASTGNNIGIISSAPKSIPLSCMVSEALEYLGFIRLQLEALGSTVARETMGSDEMFVSVA
jgi:hypothetical protein